MYFAFIMAMFGCTSQSSKEGGNTANRAAESEALFAKESRFDIGTVSQSAQRKVPFEFVLENRGKEDVKIHGIDVSCSCVVITSFPQIVRPGKDEEVKGYVDTKKTGGKISKPLFVNYDGDNILLLRVIGEVSE